MRVGEQIQPEIPVSSKLCSYQLTSPTVSYEAPPAFLNHNHSLVGLRICFSKAILGTFQCSTCLNLSIKSWTEMELQVKRRFRKKKKKIGIVTCILFQILHQNNTLCIQLLQHCHINDMKVFELILY